MITTIGTLTIGQAIPVAATATAAVDVAVGVSIGEVVAKLDAYVLAMVPSPTFDFDVQLGLAVNAYATAKGKLAALPGGAGLATALDLAVGALVGIQADIRSLDSGVALEIDAALATKASLDVQASSGVEAPSLNIGLIASQIAALGTLKGLLEAQLAVAASINATLLEAGLRVYRFDGNFANAGAELQSRLNTDGLSGQGHFVCLVPTSEASWGALQAAVAT